MPSPGFFETASAFRQWLEVNRADASELLVGYHKVRSGRPCMSWPESVAEALCFGWIDGVRKRIDDHSHTIRFTQRKAMSLWSTVTIAKLVEACAAGLRLR